MPQTLLKMCQHVADACGLGRPTAIVGSSSDTSRIMLASAQDEGESLTRRTPTGWIDLVREHTFNIAISGTTDGTTANKLVDSTATLQTSTVSIGDNVTNTTDDTSAVVLTVDTEGEITLDADIFVSGESYIIYRQRHAFPSDYKYIVDETLWDRNFYWELRGPLNPRQWQIYKSSVLGDTATTRRRRRIQNITGECKAFVIDPAPADDAVLVYEYLSNGWCQSAAGTAQTEWKKDDDTIVLDEFLYRLGLKWRVLNRLGLDYLEEKDEYETEVENAIGRDTGGDELSLTGPSPISLLTTCNVADTGFGS